MAIFFNQIKQEYIFVRYARFRGLEEKAEHVSDQSVERMVEIQNYDIISSFQIESIKMSFKYIYSLPDKIATSNIILK